MENSRAGNARSLRELASLATPMSLRVAATLRLADRITDTGTTADDLAATTTPIAPDRTLLEFRP